MISWTLVIAQVILGFPGGSDGKESENESRSVMSESLQHHGLCSQWDSSGQNTGTVAIPFSKISSPPGDQTQVSCTAGRFFPIWATGEAQNDLSYHQSPRDHVQRGRARSTGNALGSVLDIRWACMFLIKVLKNIKFCLRKNGHGEDGLSLQFCCIAISTPNSVFGGQLSTCSWKSSITSAFQACIGVRLDSGSVVIMKILRGLIIFLILIWQSHAV